MSSPVRHFNTVHYCDGKSWYSLYNSSGRSISLSAMVVISRAGRTPRSTASYTRLNTRSVNNFLITTSSQSRITAPPQFSQSHTLLSIARHWSDSNNRKLVLLYVCSNVTGAGESCGALPTGARLSLADTALRPPRLPPITAGPETLEKLINLTDSPAPLSVLIGQGKMSKVAGYPDLLAGEFHFSQKCRQVPGHMECFCQPEYLVMDWLMVQDIMRRCSREEGVPKHFIGMGFAPVLYYDRQEDQYIILFCRLNLFYNGYFCSKRKHRL